MAEQKGALALGARLMSGKGSGRRPQEAPDEQVADNWARIFGQRKQEQQEPSDHKEVE